MALEHIVRPRDFNSSVYYLLILKDQLKLLYIIQHDGWLTKSKCTKAEILQIFQIILIIHDL